MSVYDDVWGYDHHCIWAAHYEFFFHSNNRYNIVIAAEDFRLPYQEYFDKYASYFAFYSNEKGNEYDICYGIKFYFNPVGCHSTTAKQNIDYVSYTNFPGGSTYWWLGSQHRVHIWNFK